MASATQPDSAPHLRTSAVKNQEQKNGQGQQQESGRIPPPESSLVEDHFFWTYTEEPHRSRRQAIIKAHPEVRRCSVIPNQLTIPSIHVSTPSIQPIFTNNSSGRSIGNKTLRPRTPNQIHCPLRRLPPSMLRLPPPRYLHAVMEIPPHGLRDRSHLQPEPLPGYP